MSSWVKMAALHAVGLKMLTETMLFKPEFMLGY